MKRQKNKIGFTLAELLISLTILGVIATFTIPKILTAQQDQKFKATGKEAASILSGALMQVRADGFFSAATKSDDLRQYINYVNLYTGMIDSTQGNTTRDCSAAHWTCLKLHHGGVLYYWDNDTVCGTAKPWGIPFWFDPDGVSSASTTGPGKSVQFVLYGDGTIRTIGTAVQSTTYSYPGGCATPTTINPSAAADPPWFGWN